MKKDEVIANGVVVVFFSIMLMVTLGQHGVKRMGDLGSEFWPTIILSSGLIFSLLLLIDSIRQYRREGMSPAGSAGLTSEEIALQRAGRKKFCLALLCLLGYIVTMSWLGFILSTFLFTIAFILSLEERRPLVLVISPLLVTALMVLVFGRFIGMPLPQGIEFFAALGRLVY